MCCHQRKYTLQFFSPTDQNNQTIADLKNLLDSYYPWVFAPTLLKLYFSSRILKSVAHFDREYIEMPDGERISLDRLPKNYDKMPKDTPTIILVGGITTDSRSEYINIFMKYAVEDYGYRIGFMNRRGTCNMPFHRHDPDPISWDKYDDLDNVVKHVNNRFHMANLYRAGTSMGANHIQKYVGLKGQNGESLPIKALGCLASPFCLNFASKRFNEKGGIVKKALIKSLLNVFREQLSCERFVTAMKKRNIDPQVILASKSSDDYTRELDLKFRDYESLEHYKEAVSSIGYIQHIHIPTLSINSHSDLLAPTDAIPYREIDSNNLFIQMITNGGGHVEYFSGVNFRRWSYDVILTYFDNIEKLLTRAMD